MDVETGKCIRAVFVPEKSSVDARMIPQASIILKLLMVKIRWNTIMEM